MNCYLFEAPTYFFFAADVPELLYYSHIPTSIIALLVGFFVFFNNRKLLLNKLLLIISICFSLWTLASLTAWTNIHADFLAFIWPSFGILAGLLSIFSIYFVYVFLNGKDISSRLKLIFLALLSPLFIFAHTNLSVSGFNLADCDAFGFEGLEYKIYYTALGFISIFWILILLIRAYKTANSDFKKQILYLGIGIEFFLSTFIFVTFVVTQLTNLGYFEDSRLELYGLFGMTFFTMMMGILIVRFKTFNITMLAPQALVIALFVLVASQFTYVETRTAIILTSITLILTVIAGIIIVKNVKKEIKQREKIENLAEKLKKANVRLKELDKMKSEFVSIASHQLRSPLTSIRGYASMLLEGSYGKLTGKAKSAVERIADSSQHMATSVEDYLNVSRIEAGNIKYELSDFNLKDEASHIVDDKRQEAMKKGLVLSFKSDMNGQGIVNADIGKTRQILHNLLNNAIKYTPRGTITVFVHDEKKKLFVDITDSGIGMKESELEEVFGKFERAHNANKINVTGSGLGLYVARNIAEHMKGKVTAHSDGVGYGSTFRLEIPLQM
ncbi:MAG: signal transduction histidine kinase [Acidimicrobiales bacterium]|jgi:signal transduction histidine kinase